MSSQDEICSYIYQTLVEINAITLYFGSDTCQIKVGIVYVGQCQKQLKNVRCPTVYLMR